MPDPLRILSYGTFTPPLCGKVQKGDHVLAGAPVSVLGYEHRIEDGERAAWFLCSAVGTQHHGISFVHWDYLEIVGDA